MPLRIEVLSDASQIAALRASWASLTQESAAPLVGLDATNGPLWFELLGRVFRKARCARIVVGYEGEQVVGVLPVYVEPGQQVCRRLVVATELYGGRNGFLLSKSDPALLAEMLRGVRRAFGSWQSIQMTLVEGSPSAQVLEQLVGNSGFRRLAEPGWSSPYFPILEDAQVFNAGMSKGLRQTIRTANNKLRPLGDLSFVEVCEPGQAQLAIDSILAIERLSWKQEAGTAITCVPEQEAFYRELLPAGLAEGLVYGQVLLLNGDPIAYNFGLIRSGVYSCLKHSNTTEHQPFSPAQVLNANLIDSLRARGVRLYDYMGKAEPHKLRWSGQTASYQRVPTWIYSDSPCGQAGYALHRLKRWARDHLGRETPKDTEPGSD